MFTLEIKEPQSLHWVKQQVTVHSGISKCCGEKVYHPYISNDKVHDQCFVKLAVENTLDSIEIPDGVPIIYN